MSQAPRLLPGEDWEQGCGLWSPSSQAPGSLAGTGLGAPGGALSGVPGLRLHHWEERRGVKESCWLVSWTKVLARSQGGLGASQPSRAALASWDLFPKLWAQGGLVAVAGGGGRAPGRPSAPASPGVNSGWSLAAPPSSPP